MRIDKFLKNSRIIKRRTIAKEACQQERIKINEKIAKPSDLVKIGDIIEVEFGSGTVKLEVLNLKDGAKKDDAQNLYKLL